MHRSSLTPEDLYYIARDITRKRLSLKEEEIISSNPKWASLYAANVIRGPWASAEKNIKTDDSWWYWYRKNVVHTL